MGRHKGNLQLDLEHDLTKAGSSGAGTQLVVDY